MNRIFPNLSNEALNRIDSSAEVKVYRALRSQLNDEYLVIFQPRWILKRESESARDGETDFVIAHPNFGYFTLEVKGGGISFDGTNWKSKDRNGIGHFIRDPIKQAMDAKFAIRAKLRESNKLSQSIQTAPIGHAVFFTDIDSNQALVRPDLPKALIGIRNNLESLEDWVAQVLDYWKGSSPNSLGATGIANLFDVLVHAISVESSLGGRLADLGDKRIQLTENQFAILDFISSRRRVAIAGGAGTGKTLLAVEKAKRLAADGFKTLLTCYNRELATFLADQLSGIDNIVVSNFHSLCTHYVTQADRDPTHMCMQDAKRAYPRSDYWDIQLPVAMSYALEFVKERFDAIVVDEGQDFGDEYWMPLEFLLSDIESSPFYIFYDTHQNLYSNSMNFPITDSPFSLSRNCRNTLQIHNFAYQNYKGPQVDAPSMDGDSIHTIEGSDIANQAKAIIHRVSHLVAQGNVKPDQIVVLIGNSIDKEVCYNALRSNGAPSGARWNVEGGFQKGSVLIETVKRFKGLEAEVVFLWTLPDRSSTEFAEVVYVGATRACADLTIVATSSELAELKL